MKNINFNDSVVFLKERFFKKICITVLIVFFGFLLVSGYLYSVVMFLDSPRLSFVFGGTRISVLKIIKSVGVIILIARITSMFSGFVEKQIADIVGIKSSNRALMIKVIQIVIYAIAFAFGLDIVGIDLKMLTIFGGAIGIGVGFGLQSITSNFISGLILIFEKSIKNNDVIELSDGTCGFVKNTGARYTLVETFSGKEIMIPNDDFIKKQVVNWTYSNANGRIEIKVGLPYGSDVKLSSNLMVEAAREYDFCIQDPAPKCFLTDFTINCISVTLFFWIDNIGSDRNKSKSDVMHIILEKFKANNIDIFHYKHIMPVDVLCD